MWLQVQWKSCSTWKTDGEVLLSEVSVCFVFWKYQVTNTRGEIATWVSHNSVANNWNVLECEVVPSGKWSPIFRTLVVRSNVGVWERGWAIWLFTFKPLHCYQTMARSQRTECQDRSNVPQELNVLYDILYELFTRKC